MKKFNFNFKFLDRFKKNKPEEIEEVTEDIIDGEEETFNFQEMPRQNKKDNMAESEIIDDLSFSDENPEVFAERSLNDYKLDKFHEENAREQLESAVEQAAEESVSTYNDPQRHTEEPQGHASYDTESRTSPEELEPPVKPEAATRFSFKFPQFKKAEKKPKEPKAPKSSREPGKKGRFAVGSPMNSLDKFRWNDFVLKLFSPYARGKIHGVFVILLVVTLTYLIGKSAALLLGRGAPIVATSRSNISIPIEKKDTGAQDINRISSTNLFNIKETDKKEAEKKEVKDIASIVCVDAEKPTAEPLKLLDTIVLQDSVKSVASVQVRGSNELVNVREGEQLNNAVEVSKINRMKIILKNLSTGDCEYISSVEEDAPLAMPNIKIIPAKQFKSMSPDIKNAGNNFKIKRQFRDKLIGNMSEVLTQAKAIQITNPDGSLSFKMTEVVPGSVYSMLDIQNDDVITSINGKKIENLNELMSLLGKIKEIDQFQIGRKRNGMSENLEFGFE